MSSGCETVVAQALGETRTVEAVNVAQLGVHFVARAGFHQDTLAAAKISRQFIESVMRLRASARHFLFPQRLGDHAKHRAAIEQHVPVGQNVEFQVAQLQDFAPDLCGLSPRPELRENFIHRGVWIFLARRDLGRQRFKLRFVHVTAHPFHKTRLEQPQEPLLPIG